ncbi:hypothetical protein [Sutcliffiella horikoshii]|uniref:hypothetical protein n=1 Tax=Sutcliffiella horikoshii TaxID=79883 RepID=UPI001CFF355B|nr:hypothetical protein [Sutcliffiella horikoshii]
MKKLIASIVVCAMVFGGCINAGLETISPDSVTYVIEGDGRDHKDDPGIGWRY